MSLYDKAITVIGWIAFLTLIVVVLGYVAVLAHLLLTMVCG